MDDTFIINNKLTEKVNNTLSKLRMLGYSVGIIDGWDNTNLELRDNKSSIVLDIDKYIRSDLRTYIIDLYEALMCDIYNGEISNNTKQLLDILGNWKLYVTN